MRPLSVSLGAAGAAVTRGFGARRGLWPFSRLAALASRARCSRSAAMRLRSSDAGSSFGVNRRPNLTPDWSAPHRVDR